METMTTHVGKTCPYCQTAIKPDAPVTVCGECGMPHHNECWEENGGCTTFGCPSMAGAGRRRMPARPAVPVARAQTPSGSYPCPLCGYLMLPTEATCPRCENLRRLSGHAGTAGNNADTPGAAAQPLSAQDAVRLVRELQKWNWGAFTCTVFWAASMNLWGWFTIWFIPFCGPVIAALYLGINGNQLAWRSRTWRDPKHFADTQGIWNQVGMAVLVIEVIGAFILLTNLGG